MNAQTFQFRRHPAERARQLVTRPHWGRRALAALAGGLSLVFGGASFWSFQPRESAISLLLAGFGLLVFAAVAGGVWLWRGFSSPNGRPWGRLVLTSILLTWLVDVLAIEQHQVAWLPALNGLQWTLAIALLLRLGWLTRQRTPEAEAARWAAGAAGEDVVANTLAEIESDHIVIHNLPLPGRGDADHVVVGPSGVVVIETKYLAGRIVCEANGAWLQLKRDEVRQIADPSAQVLRAANAIASRLRRYGLRDVPVRSILVMAHPRADLDVSRSPVPVVRPFELVPILRRIARDEPLFDGNTVAAVANALIDTQPARNGRGWTRSAARGQALVELACGLSVILVLVFGLLGAARVTGAMLGLTAVARESARVGARAPDAATAFDWAVARGQQVAAEYGLGGVLLDVDTSSFEVQSGPGALVPGEIRVRADTTIDLSDVPLVAWAQVQVPLERRFAEVVDPYRSAPPAPGGGG